MEYSGVRYSGLCIEVKGGTVKIFESVCYIGVSTQWNVTLYLPKTAEKTLSMFQYRNVPYRG